MDIDYKKNLSMIIGSIAAFAQQYALIFALVNNLINLDHGGT